MSKAKQATAAKIDAYFTGCLYFSISKLQRHINKLAEAAFSDVGLAPGQIFLLMALHEEKNCSASHLSEMLGLAPSTITRFIDKLEKQGLCTRKLEGRVSHTSITAKGRRLMPDIQAGWKTLFQSYSEIFGEEDAKALNKMIVSFNNTAPNRNLR